MGSRKSFEFDAKNFNFGKVKRNVGRILLYVLAYIFVIITLTVLAYMVFTLFYKTDVEKELRREIRMYEKLYPSLAPKEELLRDAIAGLQYKDNDIYEQVFHSNAPDADPTARLDFIFASDTIPDSAVADYTRAKADSLLSLSASVDEAFMDIFRQLSSDSLVRPPMILPIENISYSQTGASVGSKIDPFYKAYVYHEGLDLIASRGTPVLAAADGVVQKVGTSKKLGKTVEILHAGGYVTVYAHLESVAVRSGQTVQARQKVGGVGMSGKAFAPHLHYEVRRGNEFLDPVNYIFASVSPEEYANMLYMSVNTKQSMD